MTGNAVFQVYLPTEAWDKIKALCDRRNWTHGMLLGTLIRKCPPLEERDTTPPLHIKRSDSPHLFKAYLDSGLYDRIGYLCELRNWSHRDMMIHLLTNYTEHYNG